MVLEIFNVSSSVACIASDSVWFRCQERLRKGNFNFGRAKNGTRAKEIKDGEGVGHLHTFSTHRGTLAASSLKRRVQFSFLFSNFSQ